VNSNRLPPVLSVTALSAGDVWAGSGYYLYHFDGLSWRDMSPRPVVGGASIVRGPDGDLWLGGSGGSARPAVARFDGTSWQPYGAESGLTAHGSAASVTATSRGLYAATTDGIFRFDGERWQRVLGSHDGPAMFHLLAAVSSDELWAAEYASDEGPDLLWHYSGGRWQREDVVPGQPAPVQMTIGPDGSAWAAGTFGLARNGGAGWDVIDATPATALAFEGDRTLWVVGFPDADGSKHALWQEVSDGERWTHRDLATCDVGLSSSTSVVPDLAGGAWIGAREGYLPGGLARFDGRDCVQVTNQDGSPISPAAMSRTPEGDLRLVTAIAINDALQWSIARVSGQQLTVVTQLDVNMRELFAAPDGTLWAATDSGPARYDDAAGWTFPFSEDFPDAQSTWSWSYSVAQDGTVFGLSYDDVFGFTDTAVVRFPHQ
jgi:hypothetical protein